MDGLVYWLWLTNLPHVDIHGNAIKLSAGSNIK